MHVRDRGETLSCCLPFIAYNEQVIEFLRQPDVFTRITGRYRRQLKPELKTLIETLRSVGPSGLESQSDHPQMLELILILSLFDIANIQQPWNRANSTFDKLKAKRERKKTSQDTTSPRRADAQTDPNTSPSQTSGPPQHKLCECVHVYVCMYMRIECVKYVCM